MSNQLMSVGRNIVDRVGGFNLGCLGAVGCLLPLMCIVPFLISAWWFAPSVTQMFVSADLQPQAQVRPLESRYIAQPAPPVNGQIVQVGPTPVYPKSNALGSVYQAGVSSMMFNQPATSDRPMQPYAKYEGWGQGWSNSLMSKSAYLGRANLTGQRRTPYTKGQALSFADGTVMTIVTGDFDFTLLQDAHGTQWYCGPSVNTLSDLSGCQYWR